MQAPFNSLEEAMNQVHYENFPQESEGSKSGQSSPTYQDEVLISFESIEICPATSYAFFVSFKIKTSKDCNLYF